MSAPSRRTSELPSALEAIEPLLGGGRRLLVCLDYDGTLTPIAARPEIAQLDAATRHVVRELSTLCPTAIVSGRDRRDIEQRVAVSAAFYVGSHGFDIAGPEGSGIALQLGEPYLPTLDAAEAELRTRTESVPGAIVERKRFSIATHYRLVARELVPRVDAIVDEVLEGFPDLRREPGKEVIEVQPNVAWDKGKAVLWMVDALRLEDALPIHFGDDITDETVFAVLADDGAGIFVGEEDRATAARFRLRDPVEVVTLLRRMVVLLRARTTGQAGRTGS
jgi:trehalose-phosphatase